MSEAHQLDAATLAELREIVAELKAEVRTLREPVWLTTVQAAEALGVSRSFLDELAERAAKLCPGAVIRTGRGRQRKSWRWDGHRLGEAVAAAQAPEPRARRRPRPSSTEGVGDWKAKVNDILEGR